MSSRPYPPDYCDAETMAYLVSMGKSTFLASVAAGIIPPGIRIGGKRLWSRTRVLDALDCLDKTKSDAGPDIMEAARGKAPQVNRAA